MTTEKRLHRRFRTTRVQLRVPDRATLHAALRDVSEGGLFIETSSPPQVGETTRVELFPPGWPQPLLLSGTVVRAELTGYGLRLDSISDKTRTQIKTLVAQVANELTGPTVKSIAEAQQRLAEAESELRDTKERLARVQSDAENNRAYLERALAQAGGQRKQGNSNFVVALAVMVSFGTGIVLATVIQVARAPPPIAPHYDAPVKSTVVKSLEDTGPRRSPPLPVGIFPAPEGSGPEAVAKDGGTSVSARKPAPPSKPGTSNGPSPESGRLNLTSSAPATVLVDDEKMGSTPLKGLALKPGTYKLQFVCADGSLSVARALEVLPFSENDVEHRCP